MDVQFHNHGSIWLAQPLTNAGLEWIEENLPEDVTWWARGVVIEHHYVGDIAQGMADAGLQIGEPE